jgi:hypothetical protein
VTGYEPGSSFTRCAFILLKFSYTSFVNFTTVNFITVNPTARPQLSNEQAGVQPYRQLCLVLESQQHPQTLNHVLKPQTLSSNLETSFSDLEAISSDLEPHPQTSILILKPRYHYYNHYVLLMAIRLRGSSPNISHTPVTSVSQLRQSVSQLRQLSVSSSVSQSVSQSINRQSIGQSGRQFTGALGNSLRSQFGQSVRQSINRSVSQSGSSRGRLRVPCAVSSVSQFGQSMEALGNSSRSQSVSQFISQFVSRFVSQLRRRLGVPRAISQSVYQSVRQPVRQSVTETLGSPSRNQSVSLSVSSSVGSSVSYGDAWESLAQSVSQLSDVRKGQRDIIVRTLRIAFSRVLRVRGGVSV